MAIKSESDFEEMSLNLFNFQMRNNPIYTQYASLILKNKIPQNIYEIPFLPIDFFKKEQVICKGKKAEEIFMSSGMEKEQSKHLISDVSLYEKSFLTSFELFYGNISNYCILSLLPNYREREGSSLIYMVDSLIKNSKHPKSSFYLNDYTKLADALTQLEEEGQKTILIGVSYALLDFANQFPQKLEHTIIMETGGTKGKRKEIMKKNYMKFLKMLFH